ncbi:hypothetical protein [Acetobacter ascendens]|uniref:Uncharacterized protein n=1 Tax=Acetobacter ascendens TaxID=481146 RepID=A0A1Y0V6R9_9PROT|nr:hypothetical protein [Acetobacter ascendens]RCL04387.1 hypothetical protein BBA71_13565 [Acetobacter pasteurianus]GCD75106.1 hypothetical protein NBRC3299_1398 [Acetobacter pasteurianus NBRC 3299]ARW11776.1 hypothetical protein S101447_02739 [Acetobacter ascendens]ARW11927.1 hypothetical protein S101447_02890 [Acetobacter ascendens]ARW12175.1 hypothetical protein S101447_03138 [Acetobacter ascendens]
MDSNSLSINVLLFLLLYSVVVFIVTWLWFSERKQGLLAFFLLILPAFLAAWCGGTDSLFGADP